jgi:hypothetical protein
MNKPITDRQQQSLTRLSWVGKGTAILAWGLGCSYTLVECFMWLSRSPEQVQRILKDFAKSQPLLLAPDFHLSDSTVWLLFILDTLPVVVSSLALLLVGTFFLRLSRNELWSTRNFSLLWAAGILNIISSFFNQLSSSCQSLLVSMGLPPGERIFSFGLSSDNIYEIVVGIILCAFAWMIRESTKIHEENALYI